MIVSSYGNFINSDTKTINKNKLDIHARKPIPILKIDVSILGTAKAKRKIIGIIKTKKVAINAINFAIKLNTIVMPTGRIVSTPLLKVF